MSDPGLTNRLRQRSRRAGLAVGLSMALTIAVCIAAFAWIYAKANPYLTDFTGAQATATQNERRVATEKPTQDEGSGGSNESDPPPTETPKPRPTEAQATEQQSAQLEPTQTPTQTPTSTAFKQTHVSNPELSTNLRPQPSTSGDPVQVLPAGTPLQFLNEQQTGDDGQQWYKFRTQDGTEGWMREGTFQQTS